MEIFQSVWASFLSGSLLAGVTAVLLFKYKLKKAKNDSIRDDLKLNQEQMTYISKLSGQISAMHAELILLKRTSGNIEMDNQQFKRENQKLEKRLISIEEELHIYKVNCQCNIEELLKKLRSE